MDPSHFITISRSKGALREIVRKSPYSRETPLLGYWPRLITLGTLKMTQTILFQIPKSISRS